MLSCTDTIQYISDLVIDYSKNIYDTIRAIHISKYIIADVQIQIKNILLGQSTKKIIINHSHHKLLID